MGEHTLHSEGNTEVSGLRFVPVDELHDIYLRGDPEYVPRSPAYVERFFRVLAEKYPKKQ
eukprot:NODE_13663_length_253_cov_10.887255_g12750_i0.p2 GENE.NODE_13663_length_253_cov_10.887255_g12750_i0~~NODE_13663_length_253_cov_10.887255_g12750_i0.p2  ORF type:complete len:67 (-),score=22.89 NODE_13663_length_253_cov_10.887255_g12750_i0:52-231(-)